MNSKSTPTKALHILPVAPIPDIQAGDDLAGIIIAALRQNELSLSSSDILVITQKIVSKAENRFVDLRRITPSAKALDIGSLTGKDPRMVEIILKESKSIIRAKPEVLIVEHRLGFICTNAGVDHSNVGIDKDIVLLLPENPDRSARMIRQRIIEELGRRLAVIIIDSQGRPWREGTVGMTIGLSGLAPVQDLRGKPDIFGQKLQITTVGFADQIAGAATLLMGQSAERVPVALVRGLDYEPNESAHAAEVLRPAFSDLFR